MNKSPVIQKDTINIIFSFSFMVLLPFIVLIFPIVMILFNLVFFPFSLIHELGHLITSLWLLPSHNPILHFEIINGELVCSCDLSQELMCCLNSIIVVLAGSGSVIFIIILLLFLLAKSKNKNIRNLGVLFLLFGLLSDLPNLFPILPSGIGSPTDGYITYSFLSQMGFFPILSIRISSFFSLFSFFIVLISFYFLGSFIFNLLKFLLNRNPRIKIRDQEEINLQT